MKASFSITAFLFVFTLFGQEQELIGVIKQFSGKSYLISLQLNLDTLGAFSGTTTVDPFGPYKTVTSVKGVMQSDVITFTEIGNLETTIQDTAQRYCFIHTQGLVANRQADMNFFKGTYIGYDNDGTVCSEGEIQLSPKSTLSSKQFKKKVRSISKNKSKDKKTLKSESLALDEQEIKPDNNIIKKRKIIRNLEPLLVHESVENLKWHSESVKINLKDSYDEDGDSVAVMIDNELVEEIGLSKQGETFNFPIYNGKISIRIQALNEGYSPPTTLDVMIFDEHSIFRSGVKLEQGEWTELNLQVRKH